MIKCVYSRIRHRKGQIYYYCTKRRTEVEKTCYNECLEKEYKIPKQINKKSDKQKKLEGSRYSIIQQDLSKCYFCNNKATDWHELIKGRNRKKCIKWGLCVRTCRDCHRKTEENSEFYQETRKMAQIEWQKHYKKTEEDFRKEFKGNYV